MHAAVGVRWWGRVLCKIMKAKAFLGLALAASSLQAIILLGVQAADCARARFH